MNYKNNNTLEKIRKIFLLVSTIAMVLTLIFVFTIGLHPITGVSFGIQAFFSLLYGITDDYFPGVGL